MKFDRTIAFQKLWGCFSYWRAFRTSAARGVAALLMVAVLAVSHTAIADDGYATMARRNHNYGYSAVPVETSFKRHSNAAHKAHILQKFASALPHLFQVMKRAGIVGKTLYAHTSLVVLKELNDKQSTDVADLFKHALLDRHVPEKLLEIASKHSVGGAWKDFKTTQLVMPKRKPLQETFKEMKPALAAAGKQFKAELKDLNIKSFWSQEEHGRGGRFANPSLWFTGGVSDLGPEVADWLARAARSSNEHILNPERGHRFLIKILRTMEGVRKELCTAIENDAGTSADQLLTTVGTVGKRKTLSIRALRVLRSKVSAQEHIGKTNEPAEKPERPSDLEYWTRLGTAFTNRLETRLTPNTLRLARTYFNLVNIFDPHFFQLPEKDIDLGRAKHGFAAIDFKDGGTLNLLGTARTLTSLAPLIGIQRRLPFEHRFDRTKNKVVLADQHDNPSSAPNDEFARLKKALLNDLLDKTPTDAQRKEESRLHVDRVLSKVALALRASTNGVDRLFDAARQETRTRIAQVSPESDVKFMGDDGHIMPRDAVDGKTINNMIRTLAKPGHMRVRFTWIPSTYADTRQPISTVDGTRSMLKTRGFKIEKEMTTRLTGILSEKRIENLMFAIVQEPRQNGSDLIHLRIAGKQLVDGELNKIKTAFENAVSAAEGCEVGRMQVLVN